MQEYRKLDDMLGFQVLALFDLFFTKEVSAWSKSLRRVFFCEKLPPVGKRRRILAKKNLIRNETGFEVSCTLLLTISLCPYRPLFSLFEINKKEKGKKSHKLTISYDSCSSSKSSNFYLKTPRLKSWDERAYIDFFL